MKAKPALYEVLSVLLPNPEQTLLFRACLWSGEPGRQAWSEWCGCVIDPIKMLRDGDETLKGLLPLIFSALRDNNAEIHEALQTCLRTASLREELRINTYRQILRQVLSGYADKEIPSILVEGAALADTVYKSPSSRHSGKIDVIIKYTELTRAAGLLPSMGFSESYEEVDHEHKQIKLKHESGLPLHLSSSLFPISYYHVPFDDLWGRSQVQPIADVPTRILSPTDSLLHVCGNAFFNRTRRTLLWIFDSWFLINKYPNLDWDNLLSTTLGSNLELPLSITFGYLAEELNAPIPVYFLDKLYSAASETGREGRSHALSVAREEVRGNYIKMFFESRNWYSRAYLLNWIISSPISHIVWLLSNRNPRLFLSRHLLWPLSDVARRTLSLCRNLTGR